MILIFSNHHQTEPKYSHTVVKELVTDTNISCDEDGIRIQAMDTSHVALICVHLKKGFFKKYRCDRPAFLGLSIPSFFKLLKAAKDGDRVKLSVENEEGDVLKVNYEGKSALPLCLRFSHFYH